MTVSDMEQFTTTTGHEFEVRLTKEGLCLDITPDNLKWVASPSRSRQCHMSLTHRIAGVDNASD